MILKIITALVMRYSHGELIDRSFGIVPREGIDLNIQNRSWKRFEEKMLRLNSNELSVVLDELCHTARYDEYLQDYFQQSKSELSRVIQISYELFLAWLSRSGAWAHQLSEEQIAGFFEHLENAADLLNQGFEDPKMEVEARSLGIGVAMGMSDPDGVKYLYDRCMEIDPEHISAKFRYFGAISTRWLSDGDKEPMRAFSIDEEHGSLNHLMELRFWLETYSDYYYFYREEGMDEEKARKKFTQDHRKDYFNALKKEPSMGDDLASVYTRNYLAVLYNIVNQHPERNKMIKTIKGQLDYSSWQTVSVTTEKALRWYKFAGML